MSCQLVPCHNVVASLPRLLLHMPCLLLHMPRLLLHMPRLLLHMPRLLLHMPRLLLHMPRLLLHMPRLRAPHAPKPFSVRGYETSPHRRELKEGIVVNRRLGG